MSPLILIGIFSLVSASTITPSNVSEIVDDVIAHCNEIITSNGFKNISLPDVINGNWFVKRHFSSGSVHDLATIKRIGTAYMTTKSEGTMSQYSIQAFVGLESLEVAYQYHIKLFWIFKTSGHMKVSVNRNSALAKLVLVTDTNDGACAVLSKDVDVAIMDDLEVTIEEGGFITSIIARSVKYVLSFFLPSVIKVVNSELDEFNQDYPLSPKLTQYICNFVM